MSSSRSLDDLDPHVRPLVDAAITSWAAAGLDVLITCTHRDSYPDQQELFAQGRTAPGKIVTNAPPGESAHNYGLAIDVVPIVNGKPDWDGTHPVWYQIGQLGEAAGLQWLGRPGSGFVEMAHLQHPNWRTIAGIEKDS